MIDTEAALVAFFENLPDSDDDMPAYIEAFETALADNEPPVRMATAHAPAGGVTIQGQHPPSDRIRMAEGYDRGARESSSPILDRIINDGAAAGIVISEQVRQRVIDALQKKTS